VPIHYDVDGDNELVRVFVEGTTDAKDWTDAIADMVANPDFTPKRLLVDVRRHESVAPSEIMWKIGELPGPGARNARWALVVSHPASEGMALMLATLVAEAGVEVRTFRDPDEAEAWLKEAGQPTPAAPHSE
jgi:hypothetical protein